MNNLFNLEWGPTAPKSMTWEEAIEWCNSLGNGWNLPTRLELIYAFDTEEPGFDNIPYWSCTVYRDASDLAWFVDFYDGFVSASTKTTSYYLRAVRGGLKI